MAKVTGSLQKSTEIMKLSNQLVKLPQISQSMREMSMEMTKVRSLLSRYFRVGLTSSQAGILEEMMDETLAMDEDEEIEEEADAEVDKILFDLTNGKLGLAGPAETAPPVSDLLPHSTIAYARQQQTAEEKMEDEETERVMEQYRQQLSGLLSG